jgi:phosphatidylglycerol:prolipoprotein diacylglycerol transferase
VSVVHPVLVTLPLPRWPIPLGAAFVGLAVVGAAVALLGRRGGVRWLAALGALAGAVALTLAIRLRSEAIRLDSLPLHSFGVLVAAGIGAAVLVTRRLARRQGIPEEAVDTVAVVSLAAGVVGARLLYAATNPGDFPSIAGVLELGQGGLSLPGGLALGVLAAIVYLKRAKIRAAPFLDAAAPGALLGASLGHLGAYLAGADYGRPLGGAAPEWLVRLGAFPRWPDGLVAGADGPPALVDQVLSGRLPLGATASLPVHPTQLYDAVGSLGLAAVLLVLASRRRFHGAVALSALGAHGALRFFVGALRDDPERGLLGPSISIGWTGSLAAGLLVALIWLAASAGADRVRGASVVRRSAAIVTIGMVIYGAFVAVRSGAAPAPHSVGQWAALGCLALAVPAFAVLGGGRFAASAGRGAFTPGVPPS